jgi:hypothetical protein
VTQEGSQGRSSEGVLAMVRRMRRRTVRDCSLASRRPAVATGSFACRTDCRAIPLKIRPCSLAATNCDAESYTSNLRGSLCAIITIINSLGASFVPKNLSGTYDEV